jgi:hypothetical protein
MNSSPSYTVTNIENGLCMKADRMVNVWKKTLPVGGGREGFPISKKWKLPLVGGVREELPICTVGMGIVAV